MSTPVDPDWAALARSPRFRELTASRRRFLVAGTAFYSAYFLAYLCLLGFAPDTMSMGPDGASRACECAAR